jgi:hypothetical protein
MNRETETKLERDVRRLKLYSALLTIVFSSLLLTAFTIQNKNQKFEEIDVERINLVERDGKLRMVIANGARQHPGTVDGKPIPRKKPRSAGMIFFNERGDEVGGLTFTGDNDKERYGSLTFDKFRGDQTVALQHLEDGSGTYFSGITVNDENITTPERTAKQQAINKLPTEAERNAAFAAMDARGEFLVKRLVLGRDREKSSVINLSDAKGRKRLSMSVAADGKPTINFYDEVGKVIYTLPEESKTVKK